jgi:hypothetical protein
MEKGKEHDFTDALTEYARSINSQALLFRNSLMALIGTVEWFLSRLIHLYYKKHPETLEGKDKVFSLKDLMAFDTVESAKEYLLESKVEDIMRGSFVDWVTFFKSTCKLSMSYVEKDLEEMVEACQRRNLIVHNGSVVNSIYLSKVAGDLTKGLKKGKVISVPIEYLQKNISVFELNCILISLELWKKWDGSEQERGEIISRLSKSLMKDKRWSVSEGLNYFLINDKNIHEKYRVPAQLNYWLSVKQQGRWDNISKDAESADFSAKDPIFKLSHLILLDKVDEVFELLQGLVQSGFITKETLKENPVFEGIVEDKRFSKLFTSGSKSKKVTKKSPLKAPISPPKQALSSKKS